MVVNRRNRDGPLIIPTPFVSVIGGLPPAMLGELCDERGREDGFIHRILFSFPKTMSRELTGDGVRPETLDRYCRFVIKLRYQGMSMGAEDPATVVLDMSPCAFQLFQGWANEHYAETESGPVNLRGPWAKLVTYCARFALILHFAANVGQRMVANVVDVESVSRSIADAYSMAQLIDRSTLSSFP